MGSSPEFNLPENILPANRSLHIASGPIPENSPGSDTSGFILRRRRNVVNEAILLGQRVVAVVKAIPNRVERNRPHVNYLREQAHKTSEAETLPFTNTALYISQEKGAAIYGFGDSRSKVDMNAPLRRWWRNLKEEWTHEGAFVRGLENALKSIGVHNVASYPHAVEGDTTKKINAVFEREIEAIVADPRHVILIDFRNGNDFREAADNVAQVFGFAIAPNLSDAEGFREVYDRTVANFTKNTLHAYRNMQSIFEVRKQMGRDTSLLIITQPPFRTRVVTRVYALGKNGQEDRYIGPLPPFKAINNGGQTFIGGAFTGLKNALKIFSEEQGVLSEEMRLPIHVIPAGDIDDQPGTRSKESVFDGSYHLSQIGHNKLLQKILDRVIIL